VIGCEDRLRNDLYCVELGVKLYSNQPTSADNIAFAVDDLCTSQILRPVRRVAAERLMLLTVVALILVIVHGGPKT